MAPLCDNYIYSSTNSSPLCIIDSKSLDRSPCIWVNNLSDPFNCNLSFFTLFYLTMQSLSTWKQAGVIKFSETSNSQILELYLTALSRFLKHFASSMSRDMAAIDSLMIVCDFSMWRNNSDGLCRSSKMLLMLKSNLDSYGSLSFYSIWWKSWSLSMKMVR